MNSKKLFYGLLILTLILAIASVALTYLGAGVLQKKGSELTEQKLKMAVLDHRKTSLVNAKRDINTYAPLEKISKSIVPQEKDQARTVREIVTIAEESGIPLSSIEFPASALGEAKKKASSKATTPTTSLNKKPVSSVDPNTTQLTEVVGTKGLYAMEIIIQSDNKKGVPYARLLSFLERLENNRRTAHVINLNIEPSDNNRNLVTFTVTLNVYIKP